MSTISNDSEWPRVKLGELGDALIGLTFDPESVRASGTLVLRSSNIQDGRLDFQDSVYVDCQIPERIRIRDRDILLCVRNGSRQLIGKSAILDRRVVGQTFGAFMAVFRSEANRYLRYFFQSNDFKRQIDAHLGATINQITNSSLKGFAVFLPDVVERDEIARRLEEVDDLIETSERALEKIEGMRIGLLQQLLTGDTRLPGFQKPWQQVRLGDHVSYLKTVPLSRAQLDNTSPLRYLHYGDIHKRTSVQLNTAQEPMPRAPSLLARNAGRLQVGDVVFADASEDPAGVGKSVEIVGVPSDGVVPGLHTIAARFDKSILADGFKAYLQFVPPFRNSLLRLAAGTKVLATTRSYISSITLPLPGIEEQRAIAEVLADVDQEIAVMGLRVRKLGFMKTGTMQELLTGRTRLHPMENVS